jgi:hypothetical protein
MAWQEILTINFTLITRNVAHFRTVRLILNSVSRLTPVLTALDYNLFRG